MNKAPVNLGVSRKCSDGDIQLRKKAEKTATSGFVVLFVLIHIA